MIKVLLVMIYDSFEAILEKIKTCNNNADPSSATEINKHTACCFLSFIAFCCTNFKNKHYFYRVEDSLTKFCDTFH